MYWRPTVYAITALVVSCSLCLAEPSAESDAGSERVDFDFPGGTVAEYVEAARRVAPDLNVVVHPEAENVKLPRVVLRNVPADALIGAGIAGFDCRDQGLDLDVRMVGGYGIWHVTADILIPIRTAPVTELAVYNLADVVVSGPADPAGRDELARKLRKVVNVDFQENTLGDVLEYFRQAADVNIAPDWRALEDYEIGRDSPVTIHLKEVPVAVALKTIIDDLRVGVYYSIDEGVVRVLLDDRKHSRERGITIQQLLTAIETALEMLPRSDQPADLKYHADTSLLIVRGDQQQLDTVQRVITAVRPVHGSVEKAR